MTSYLQGWYVARSLYSLSSPALGIDITRGARYNFVYFPAVIVLVGPQFWLEHPVQRQNPFSCLLSSVSVLRLPVSYLLSPLSPVSVSFHPMGNSCDTNFIDGSLLSDQQSSAPRLSEMVTAFLVYS